MKPQRTSLVIAIGIGIAIVIGIYAGIDAYNSTQRISHELNQSQAFKDLQEHRMSILEYCSHEFRDNESQKLCVGVSP